MTAASYDAIVMGTGQSGPYATSRLAAAGMKVAVIERKVFGENLRQHRLHSDQNATGRAGTRPFLACIGAAAA